MKVAIVPTSGGGRQWYWDGKNRIVSSLPVTRPKQRDSLDARSDRVRAGYAVFRRIKTKYIEVPIMKNTAKVE